MFCQESPCICARDGSGKQVYDYPPRGITTTDPDDSDSDGTSDKDDG